MYVPINKIKLQLDPIIQVIKSQIKKLVFNCLYMMFRSKKIGLGK
jgi:hypothetical protein